MIELRRGRPVPVTFLAEGCPTLGDLLARRRRATPDRPACWEKVDGRWTATSWEELGRRCDRVASGLVALGLAVGERVAILGPTRARWAVFDLGAQRAGLVSVGLYGGQTVDQLRHAIGHSGARAVLVDGDGEASRVLEAVADLPAVRAIVPWTPELAGALAGRDERIVSPERLEGGTVDPAALDARLAAVGPGDAAILIYTSGTTGRPKGARITHANILAFLAVQPRITDLLEDDLSFSFLPLAHAAQRLLGLYTSVGAGVPTAYASSMATVLDELLEVRPTLFGAVPRLFEKAHDRFRSEVDGRPAAVRRLVEWALRVGAARAGRRLAGRPIGPWLAARHAVADRLVLARVRAAFGGRARRFLVGAAPIPRAVLDFFWAVGMEIYECYGQTEATVMTHCNRIGEVRLGTVGRPIPGVLQRIAADGEVLVRGPIVFGGYHDDPEATARAIVDGWLATGDIGSIDADGYLSITDRKKHLIITAGGKNLAPATIEKAIAEQDPLISRVVALGDGRPYVVALVAPSPLETLEWGRRRGLLDDDLVAARTAELMADPTARSEALGQAMAVVVADRSFAARIARAVRAGNEHLARHEAVRRFRILEADLRREAGELTPTLKVRRRAVEEIHRATIERIYDEPGFAHEPDGSE